MDAPDPWQILKGSGLQARGMLMNIFAALPWWQQMFLIIMFLVAIFSRNHKCSRRRQHDW